MIKNTYQILSKTGVFVDDCWEWNKWAAGNKIPLHLKVFFATDHRECCLSIKNDTGAPYGAEHNATENLDNGYFHQ